MEGRERGVRRYFKRILGINFKFSGVLSGDNVETGKFRGIHMDGRAYQAEAGSPFFQRVDCGS